MEDEELDNGLDEMIGKQIVGVEIDPDEETMTIILEDDTALLIGGTDMYLKFMRDEQTIN